MESIIAGFDYFESIGWVQAKSKVMAMRIVRVMEAAEVLLLNFQRLDGLL